MESTEGASSVDEPGGTCDDPALPVHCSPDDQNNATGHEVSTAGTSSVLSANIQDAISDGKSPLEMVEGAPKDSERVLVPPTGSAEQEGSQFNENNVVEIKIQASTEPAITTKSFVKHSPVIIAYDNRRRPHRPYRSKRSSKATLGQLQNKGGLKEIIENKLLNRLILGRRAFLSLPKQKLKDRSMNNSSESIAVPTEIVYYADDESIKTEQLTTDPSKLCTDDDAVDLDADFDATLLPDDFIGVPGLNFESEREPSESEVSIQDGPVVSKDTFRRTDWFRCYETLNIHNCAHRITHRHVEASAETLTVLRCHGLISFKSIFELITTCSKLQKLKFSNITIVHKGHSDKNGAENEVLRMEELKTLEIVELNRRFTKYDYWLLYFFCRSVDTPKLCTFTFRASDYFQQDPRMKVTRVQVSKSDPSVISKFLVKNHKSIERLAIGGLGFQLYQHEKGAACFPEVALIQPKSLSISLGIRNIEDLLVHQGKLQEFTCTGFVSSIDDVMRLALAIAIQESKNTLKSIAIEPTVVTKCNGKHYAKIYAWDCEIFRRCKVVESINFNISIASRVGAKQIPCSTLSRMHLLPLTLVRIELHLERFTGDELDVFFTDLHKFTKLQRLKLASGSGYLLHLKWIQNLVNLPTLTIAEFHGGKLKDLKDTCKFMLSKPRGFVTMTLLNDRICFQKPGPMRRETIDKLTN